MKTSQRGKIALAVSEGIVNTAYLDSVGVWTIGIGLTKSAGLVDPKNYIGKTVEIKQVFEWFDTSIKKYESIVDRNVKVPLAQNEYDALVHFVYNVGEPNFKKSNLLKLINAGNKKQGFDKGFHGWLKPPELKSRRDKERDIALNGKYGGTIAPVYTANAAGKTIRNGSIDLKNVYGAGTPAEPNPTPTPSTPNVPAAETIGFWATVAELIVNIFKNFGKK